MLSMSMERVKEIELLDAMCGTGKSYNLFKFVSQNPHERYIYVTPMLTEAESRAAKELAKFGDPGVVFEQPTGVGYRTKGDHLLDLLEAGKSVSCTHSLFENVGKAGRLAILKHEYTLIIDEELGMITPLSEDILASADRKALIEKGAVSVEADGKVVWKDDCWGGGKSAFNKVRKLAEDGALYSNQHATFFSVQLPIELIAAAKRVIVASYMFKGSVLEAFLKVKGIGWKPFTFEGMELRDEKHLKAALRERIEFCDFVLPTERLHQKLGVPMDDLAAKVKDGTFSASWYLNAKRKELDAVGHHIRSVARQMRVKVDDLLYTLPSTNAGKRGDKWVSKGPRIIKVKSFGAKTCFLHKGARATNDYCHKTAAIHAYNRYPHPAVRTYLRENGADVDENAFALAELIQWFFRTAIRIPDGPKVKLHIASPRMDKLFKDWLNS